MAFSQSIFKYLKISFYEGNAGSPLNTAVRASLFSLCIQKQKRKKEFFKNTEYSRGERWCPAAYSAQPVVVITGSAQGLAKPLGSNNLCNIFEGENLSFVLRLKAPKPKARALPCHRAC